VLIDLGSQRPSGVKLRIYLAAEGQSSIFFTVERRLECIAWAKNVVAGLRSTSSRLEQQVDLAATNAEQSINPPLTAFKVVCEYGADIAFQRTEDRCIKSRECSILVLAIW
jgi:hypothetical protein